MRMYKNSTNDVQIYVPKIYRSNEVTYTSAIKRLER